MSTATAPAIRVEGLEKSFKDLHVLRGVDFDVERGSIFALLGSNGAGKTTVIRILATLLRADAGRAGVNGFDVVSSAPEVRESISLTGQFAAVDDVLTGRENLVLVARLRHLPDAGRIAERLLARFQLTDAAERRVGTYSGGMRRRLDIAMSLIGDPPVVFLDEPTTGLDPEAHAELWAEIGRLADDERVTVLLTTHYLDEADHLADRLAIVDRGRAVVEGTPDELKAGLHGDAVDVGLASAADAARATATLARLGLRDVVVEGKRLRARADDGARSVPAVLAALDEAGAP
ncbi:MAG: ABC transporter ATP-binding protein, partial [Ornithinibacter sp.]